MEELPDLLSVEDNVNNKDLNNNENKCQSVNFDTDENIGKQLIEEKVIYDNEYDANSNENKDEKTNLENNLILNNFKYPLKSNLKTSNLKNNYNKENTENVSYRVKSQHSTLSSNIFSDIGKYYDKEKEKIPKKIVPISNLSNKNIELLKFSLNEKNKNELGLLSKISMNNQMTSINNLNNSAIFENSKSIFPKPDCYRFQYPEIKNSKRKIHFRESENVIYRPENKVKLTNVTKLCRNYNGKTFYRKINVNDCDLRKMFINEPPPTTSKYVGHIVYPKVNISEVKIFDYKRSKFDKFNKISRNPNESKFYNLVGGYDNYFYLKEKFILKKI